MKKSEKEIKLIKKAASIANKCLPFIEKILKKEKITEKKVSILLEKKIKSLDGKPAFETLVASGKRASLIHAKPTNKIIEGVGYIDFGVSYRGYNVDLTVPFIKGQISEDERKIVDIVLRAYELSKSLVKVGVNCQFVFKEVDNFLRKYGYRMEHSLGHGIGKKVHEKPTIGIPEHKIKKMSKKIKEKIDKIKSLVFENNVVFTLEPAIYVKNVGGCRIENTFLLKKEKLVELTKAKLIVC